MVAAALNKTGILSIGDVILIICGIYCMVTAGKMKKNHVLPQWLFSEQELRQIRHPEKFCEKMGPKTTIFGLVCTVFGIYGLVIELLWYQKIAEAVGIGVLLVGIAWYTSQLNKAKRTYI
ncbi:hypothetical protein [uncultured Eubacterium sp.]|uniref:hypothetical protein n=1 Tax=uncultured Eubacterium sp. TaxID=165185 RepID=UPI0025FAF759|nr:hypothetical protein [uncultured Eubacterium sp.]